MFLVLSEWGIMYICPCADDADMADGGVDGGVSRWVHECVGR